MKNVNNFIISPHLLLYRPQISSIFSIFQRITGVVLSFIFIGYIFFYVFEIYFLSFFWFYKLSLIFFIFQGYFRITLIIFIIFFFFFHLFNGLKFLFFETEPTGELVTLEIYYFASFIALSLSFLFTLIFWFILFF